MGELDDDGRQAIAAAGVKTARGYTGHEHLERTGLIHMNGRVYYPVLGRFLSPDPVVADATYSQSWNAYSYALNSPLSFSDPSGHIVRPKRRAHGRLLAQHLYEFRWRRAGRGRRPRHESA